MSQLSQKYIVYFEESDKFFTILESRNFDSASLKCKKEMLEQAKKLLICKWGWPMSTHYLKIAREYDDKYRFLTNIEVPLYGKMNIEIKLDLFRTSTEWIKRRYMDESGKSDVAEDEIINLLFDEFREKATPKIKKAIKDIRDDINEFIKNYNEKDAINKQFL